MKSIYRILRGIVLKVLYPLFMFFGAFFKGKRENLQQIIIRLNNRLVRAEAPTARKLLLLLPHCLQFNECDIRITHNIHNCKGCGRCEIKDLIQIADELSLDLFVATGGTLARRIVQDVRPGAIIAIACERDLSSGLSDTFPMPILGITNDRPFGPCFNTRVDLERVKDAIRFFSH